MRSQTMTMRRPYYAKYTYHRHVCRRMHFRSMYYRKIKETIITLLKIIIPVCVITISAMITVNILRTDDIDDIEEITEEILPLTVEYSSEFVIDNGSDSTERIITYSILTDPNSLPLEERIGDDEIVIDNFVLHKYDTPDVYYGDIDFSSFQPWMDYRMITNTRSGAYKICNSDRCYTDSNGLRRYMVSDDQFSIDGIDDYVVALGTFYKPKDQVGLRYLIVTTTGMFTIITGDEKADVHTDNMNMFTTHKNGVAGIIEWIVDVYHLNSKIKSSGTVTEGPVEELNGEILYIYGIEENNEN